MIAEKRDEGGNYLKVAFVEKNEITDIQITGDVTEVKFVNDGKESSKYQAPVTFEDQGKGDPDTWTMNTASSNALIDELGPDTSKWDGVRIPITIDGTGEYRHYKVDRVRLKKRMKKHGDDD